MARSFDIRTSPPLTLAAWLRHDTIRLLLGELDDVQAVLEVGAGEGAFGVRLASAYEYVGVEPDEASAAKARARLTELGRGSVVRGLDELEPRRRFDLICAFEVLEHIADEQAALAEWRRRLRPEGWLLLSLPAGQHRLGAADRRAGHYRRYDPEGVTRVLEEAEFVVYTIEHVGLPLGYALETLRHVIATLSHGETSLEARSGASGRWLQPPEGLAWATRSLTAPFRFAQARMRNRLGTNLIALAQLARQPSRTTSRARGDHARSSS